MSRKLVVLNSVFVAILPFLTVTSHATPTVSAPEAELSFSWRGKDGQAIPDTANRKSKNNFAAQLFLTEDKDLWHQWAVLPSSVAPRITPIGPFVKRNTPVFIVLIFANPKVDEKGDVKVTCDITITKPDGKISHPPKPIGRQGKFGKPSTNLQLGYPQIGYGVENSDPKGEYTVEGLVRDHNRNVEMKLRTSFTVE